MRAGACCTVSSALVLTFFRLHMCSLFSRKFSASKFFEDCAANDVTIIQYIGQLARYLLATPPGAFDQAHRVRMALGNGLGEDVWDAFRARFNIERIGEFYASTEGNANLVNNLNRKGVIGWIPPIISSCRLLSNIYPVRIVRFDNIEEKPIRDAHGHCVECDANETGELLSKIDARDPLKAFDGYSSARATSDKILSNVFSNGDRWFRSGDLVRADADGLIRFIDRVGDTFRWKGENVATTEVATIMSSFTAARGLALAEVNVYGVYVVGNEGRAGMASISLEGPTNQLPRESVHVQHA
jgi:acyl-CoA synthetase (AMP-forming)/AMP-acid ligase II